jgi:hypothetical protein
MRHESCTVIALVGAAHPAADPPGTGIPGTGRPGTGSARTGSARTASPGSHGAGPRSPGPQAATGPANRTQPGVTPAARVPEPLLAELDNSANISVVRPPAQDAGVVESAILALRQAARRSSPFALVPADPLAAVAAQWQAMWDLTRGSVAGSVLFEEEVSRALAAWRARQFELPDYYLVLADTVTGDTGPDFYLGPLRAARPHRVVVAAPADGPEQAAWIRDALRSLRQGPWWPPLDEVLDTARRFFAGGLAEASATLATPKR